MQTNLVKNQRKQMKKSVRNYSQNKQTPKTEKDDDKNKKKASQNPQKVQDKSSPKPPNRQSRAESSNSRDDDVFNDEYDYENSDEKFVYDPKGPSLKNLDKNHVPHKIGVEYPDPKNIPIPPPNPGLPHSDIVNPQANEHGRISRHIKSAFTDEEFRNQEIWKETERIVENGEYEDINKKLHDIKSKLDFCNKNTRTIHKDLMYDEEIGRYINKEKEDILNRIEIWPDSTFGAALKLKVNGIKDVCALNFASATKPGGGVKNGRKAQEETLSRQSSLYFSICDQVAFYGHHLKYKSPFYTHYMIYSPNVVVFRDDDYRLIPYFTVSVITSAAVNYTQLYKTCPPHSRDDDIEKCMKKRCRKILQIAFLNNNKAVVLRAFGCGVFGNKPEVIKLCSL